MYTQEEMDDMNAKRAIRIQEQKEKRHQENLEAADNPEYKIIRAKSSYRSKLNETTKYLSFLDTEPTESIERTRVSKKVEQLLEELAQEYVAIKELDSKAKILS